MASWFDSIDLTVEIAFGGAPKAASPTWTDVSAYVRSTTGIEIERGTNSELLGISPGFCRLRLDNRDRRFDPSYTSGPHHGGLVPMTKIRVTATLGVTAVTLFTGYVLGWAMDWQLSGDGTIEVTAVDGSRFVENAQLASSAWADLVENDASVLHYWPLQDASDVQTDRSGSVSLARTGTGTPSVVEMSAPRGESSGLSWSGSDAGWQATARASVPRGMDFWVYGSSPTVELVARTGRYDNLTMQITSGSVTQIRFSHDGDADSYTLNTLTGDDPITLLLTSGANHIAAYSSGATFVVRVNGVTIFSDSLGVGATDWGADEPKTAVLQSSGGISHWALYSNIPGTVADAEFHAAGVAAYGHPFGERSGERITRILDEIGWPAAQRSIDTGDTVQGPYLPGSQRMLDYAKQVADSERGLLFFDVEGNIAFRSRNTIWTLASRGSPLYDENGDLLLDENDEPLYDGDPVIYSDDGASGAVKYHRFRPAGNHVDNIRNIVTTSYSTVGAITRRDQTSIDAYGEGREFIDGPTIPDARTASGLSAYVLRENKDPKDYVAELECHMRLTSGVNEFDTLAPVELGDIITVEHTPLGVGSQTSRVVMVTGLRHVITGDQWDVLLYCSAAPIQNTAAPYLTIGDATYGKIGAAAGNLIPF